MLVSTRFLLIALALSSSAIASALSIEAEKKSVAGAAYFMSNDPSGNKVVSVNIASDGTLGPNVRGVNTNGIGSHGLPIATDALFSQGSLQVNTKARILVTVNAGSDTVSMFNIDPSDPTKLTLVGSPVHSGGSFPQSVAINSRGDTVCVLNGGAVNGVNCFTAHPFFGLIPKPNTLRLLHLTQTTPPTGPPGALSQIIFTPDDSRVIASVKGVPPTPGFLATWTVSADGSLSALPVRSTPATGGLLPFSITPIPDTNAFLVTDPGIGFEIFNFGGSNGRAVQLEASSTVTPVPGQKALCWSTFSSKSGNFYIIDAGTAIITEVHVDKNLKASIVKQYPQAPGSGTLDSDIATVKNNNFLYTLAANTASIDVLAVNVPGKAAAVQTFDFTSAAKAAGITFSNVNLQGMATFILEQDGLGFYPYV